MRGLVFGALAFLAASGIAVASRSIEAENMAQPGAPVEVVGCSAVELPMQNGSNVHEHASFQVTGPKTATGVRIGFAYFDALSGRHISSAVLRGTFSPGVRVDMPQPFAGRIGAETEKVVCFAMQADFADGTSWHVGARGYPGTAPAASVPATRSATVMTETVSLADAPVRFDRCDVSAPQNGAVATSLALTNTSERSVRRVDVDFVFYGASGSRANHNQWMRGDYAPGATIRGGIRLEATDSAYTKISCALRSVQFTDGTTWSAPATGGGRTQP